jgi:hypothetical protein
MRGYKPLITLEPEYDRTTDLRFTNKLPGMAQVIDDVGHLLVNAA